MENTNEELWPIYVKGVRNAVDLKEVHEHILDAIQVLGYVSDNYDVAYPIGTLSNLAKAITLPVEKGDFKKRFADINHASQG